MKNTTTIKEFWTDTYKSGSPIPFIISAQIIVFVFIHFFKLLFDVEIIETSVFTSIVEKASLPPSFDTYIQQAWSIVSYPFIYTSLFSLLFDCLWLYFIGNSFLNLLNRRQFLTVYIGATLLGALLYLLINQLPFVGHSTASLYEGTLPLAAMIAATATLTPKSEIRLFLFGNVKLYILAAIYLGLQLIHAAYQAPSICLTLALTIFFGYLFIQSLRNGNDWSRLFVKTKKRKLKVVHHSDNKNIHNAKSQSLSNQEVIDKILDKISAQGYESLSAHEKETLFKASKED